MLQVVGAVLLFVAFKKCNPFSIRRPLRARPAGAIVGRRQKLFRGASLGCSDEQLCCRIPIRIVGMIAHEGDPRAIG